MKGRHFSAIQGQQKRAGKPLPHGVPVYTLFCRSTQLSLLSVTQVNRLWTSRLPFWLLLCANFPCGSGDMYGVLCLLDPRPFTRYKGDEISYSRLRNRIGGMC